MVTPTLGLWLRDRLGPEASQDLSHAFEEVQNDMLTVTNDRFERRLMGVSAELGREMARMDAGLRDWRKDEATKKRVPAFRIMTDKEVLGIAASRPEDETALLAVKGVGPSLVAKHGGKILEIVHDA